jgi:hypothetical protein
LKHRLATSWFALLLTSCSSSSTDFCSQTVKIDLAAASDGGCDLVAIQQDDGLALTVIVPSDHAACTEAMKSCSTEDQDILKARVDCANDAGMNPPACVNDDVEQWESIMDQALGSCIATNIVSSDCQSALNAAGN